MGFARQWRWAPMPRCSVREMDEDYVDETDAVGLSKSEAKHFHELMLDLRNSRPPISVRRLCHQPRSLYWPILPEQVPTTERYGEELASWRPDGPSEGGWTHLSRVSVCRSPLRDVPFTCPSDAEEEQPATSEFASAVSVQVGFHFQVGGDGGGGLSGLYLGL